jgi:methylmalonyl-CoA/ethylmalonyl-CoA epimerase
MTNPVSEALAASDLVISIDHVGVAVPDFDAAVAWYRDNLGMALTHDEVNEQQGVHEGMLSVPGQASTAAQLQILAPLNDKSTVAKFIARSGPGLQQLAYRVKDVEKLADLLRSHGVRLLYETPQPGTANSRINFVHPKDAGGVLVELVQLAPESH